jgi:hypothetical protein
MGADACRDFAIGHGTLSNHQNVRSDGLTAAPDRRTSKHRHRDAATHDAAGVVNGEYEGVPAMNKVIGIALAFTIIGGMVLVAEGPELQSANGAHAYSINLDRCPYYPSPVACHSRSTGRSTIGRWTTPSHAAVGG